MKHTKQNSARIAALFCFGLLLFAGCKDLFHSDGSDGSGDSTMPSNLSLADSLIWISNNAADGGNYTITLSANASIAPKMLSYNGKNVNITLAGGSTERTVYLVQPGPSLTVDSGVTLTLDNNLTLQGRNGNADALVWVDNGGMLVMNAGSKVSGNTSSSYGGGVFVSGGTFTMSGGTISGNTASSGGGGGGGVFVSGGTFTMSGGTISGNTASSASVGKGGGVYVSSGGTFTMSGGTISGNTASSSFGGGVYVYLGAFTMSGGTISGNSSASGGGVAVTSGTFTKQGGTIYGSNASSLLKNTAANGNSYGHAVYVINGGKRDTTAGTGVTLDSSVSGSSGGWE
ncbi:MAG: hypothetical protein LBQ88_05885 [Treponema sp.]|jgi:hypothetical protein|nr:hypothetical protein [Treponema sp.]